MDMNLFKKSLASKSKKLKLTEAGSTLERSSILDDKKLVDEFQQVVRTFKTFISTWENANISPAGEAELDRAYKQIEDDLETYQNRIKFIRRHPHG